MLHLQSISTVSPTSSDLIDVVLKEGWSLVRGLSYHLCSDICTGWGVINIEGGVLKQGLSLLNPFYNAIMSVQEGSDQRCSFYIFVRGVIFGEQFC